MRKKKISQPKGILTETMHGKMQIKLSRLQERRIRERQKAVRKLRSSTMSKREKICVKIAKQFPNFMKVTNLPHPNQAKHKYLKE